jgi:hypothetical protein
MTTDHQMATMHAAQQRVIVALRGIDVPDLAARLKRCMTARRDGQVVLPFPLRMNTTPCPKRRVSVPFFNPSI